ncbi:MAG: MarR family winged helix-turn-helix transcriptional regulator [Deltaproteobacteria bacterium]
MGDQVDAIIAAWGRERPDLDVAPVGVVSRVARVAARFSQALEANFAGHGLTKADFEALAALRRSGAPYRLSQTRLMRELSLTPGTVSVRIARLVERGFVERLAADDRRGVIVGLLPAGERAFEDVVHDHLATERRLLAALDPGEQELLAGLLRRLLTSGTTEASA